MNTYRVAAINTILNFRRIVNIEAPNRFEARIRAHEQLDRLGYRTIESVVCIADWKLNGVH